MPNRYYTNKESMIVIDLSEVVGIEGEGHDDKQIAFKGGAVMEVADAPGLIKAYMDYIGVERRKISNKPRKQL